MGRMHFVASTLVVTLAACASDGPTQSEADEPASRDAAAEAEQAAEDAEPVEAVEPSQVAEDAMLDSNIREQAGCTLDTGYMGDDACIQPPAPDEGFQLHYGPLDHGDPAQIEDFLLQPGSELLDCVYTNSTNDGRIFYDYYASRFRPLTHHMIVTRLTTDVDDGHRGCDSDGMGSAGLVGGSSVASQAIGADAIAPENLGLAAEIPALAQMSMQLHFFNFTDEAILREAWMNVYYKDPATVGTITAPLQGMSGLGGLVAAGGTGTWQGRMAAPADIRIVNLYSHFHAHTMRMTAWKYPVDGTDPSMVYETFDWEHPDVFAYDSAHVNRPPDRETKTPGGHSGLLELKVGDELVWECEIVNDLEIPLRWANEALTAEMCILRGNYAPSWGEPWSAAVQ